MADYTQYKPQKTLTQLEDEPESGFFGCTYTEVITAMKKAMLLSIGCAVLGALFIYWVLSAILSMFVGWIYFRQLIIFASKQRADKPLFYHKHITTYKSAQFIQPPSRMQRERNNPHDRKKQK